MATKRRKRLVSLGHITTREVDLLQNSMDAVGAMESIYRADGHKAAADLQLYRLSGMENAASALGIPCICFPVDDSGFTQCACAKTRDALKKKALKKKADYKRYGGLAGGFGLSEDGVRCRDGQGSFVPVSQCKGPVGRDGSGRFVSIKDL